ncbi:MAG: TetR/AcrR family transcriptional regulator [Pseudomonadota bacterium]
MSRKDIKLRRKEKINHILATATKVFAEKGYAGASTNEIADMAGISKRTMYYYMGDKDTLYTKVLEQMLDEAYSLLDVGIDANQPVELKLAQFIHSVAQIANNRPLHAIALRELLSGGTLPKIVTDSLYRMFTVFTEILEEGTKKGAFNDKNPVIMGLMLFSFFVYWDLVTPLLTDRNKVTDAIKVFGADISDQLIDEVQSIFLKFLTTK